MKLGLIVRGEDRGLGIQTWEAYRHLKPERTLLLDMGEFARGFASHPERYPDATLARFAPGEQLPEATVREWLDGLDVVLSCETFYDWRVVGWASEQNVATVCQVNPEFFRPHAPRPTAIWLPTPWLLNRMPADALVVPVPVALERFERRTAPLNDSLRVLHVAGHRAAGDRNGTNVVSMASRHARERWQLRVVSQDAHLSMGRTTKYVRVTRQLNNEGDYWELYRDADVLVLPRRYGGLCLPAQEAMAAGLAVVMPDCSPNDFWPTIRVPCTERGELRSPSGAIPFQNAHASTLARAVDQLARDPEQLAAAKNASRAWAEAHSWEALLPLYRQRLAEAVEKEAVQSHCT